MVHVLNLIIKFNLSKKFVKNLVENLYDYDIQKDEG